MRKRKLLRWGYTWAFSRKYLDSIGYAVYPSEIVCGLNDLPYPKRSFHADAAVCKDGDYYAFEYKSAGDSIVGKRVKEQVANYSKSFDFVIVVLEIPRHDASINPKRGNHARQLAQLGAGIWTVQFGEVEDTETHRFYHTLNQPKFNVLLEPKRQQPNPENKQWIINKFQRYVYGKMVPEDPRQKTLTDF